MSSSVVGIEPSASELIFKARAKDVRTDQTHLTVVLEDGRIISAPLVWYPRLFTASPQQRARWEFNGPGIGIHWPEIDEDISVEGLLLGLHAPPSEFRRLGLQPPKR